MFVFEPNLRSVASGEVATKAFLKNFWDEVGSQSHDPHIRVFKEALESAYCGDDETLELYTTKNASLLYSLFLCRCLLKNCDLVTWTGLFYLPPFDSEVLEPIRPQLLWFDKPE